MKPNYHLTALQLKLHKAIRVLEIRAIRHQINVWHQTHDSRIAELKLAIKAFDDKYIIPIRYLPLYPKNTKNPERWDIDYIKGGLTQKIANKHVDNQMELKKLTDHIKLISGPYLRQKRLLKKLDKINGSLKSQGVI